MSAGEATFERSSECVGSLRQRRDAGVHFAHKSRFVGLLRKGGISISSLRCAESFHFQRCLLIRDAGSSRFPFLACQRSPKVVARNFYEAIIQRKVVANIIQQLLLIPAKIREAHQNELIDLIQCPHAVWGIIDGHCNQCNVQKWRLYLFGQVRFASRLYGVLFAGWKGNVMSFCVDAFYIGGEAVGSDGSIFS